MASISFSLGGPAKAQPARPPSPKPQNGVKRSHAALGHDSDDEDAPARGQEVTHFDVRAGGAIDVSKPKVEKKALVIQAQKNRDWKEAARQNKRQKYGVPDEQQKEDRERLVKQMEDAKKVTYGLVERKSETPAEDQGADGEGAVEAPGQVAQELDANGEEDVPERKSKTDDERAMDALLGIKPDSALVLPTVSEAEAFSRDYKTAPDMATLDEYNAVPVEEFGAALLRGMGWKEGQGIGSQRGVKVKAEKMPERRPALLGIGAKADKAIQQELGAWGKSARRGKESVIYNPLMVKDKATGEIITEEEMKRRMEERKQSGTKSHERSPRGSDRDHDRKENSSSRRHRYDDDDDEEYDRKRGERRKEIEYESKGFDRNFDRKRNEKRRERDYDDDRKRSSKRIRSESPNSERRSGRDRDDYDDRRERDRKRRDRYVDDRDRDRDRDRRRRR